MFCRSAKIKKNVALWNFNMGVNGKIIKCAISWKRLIVDRNGRKFGTRSNTMHIYRVLLMSDSLSLVWGQSVHFAKLLMWTFSKKLLLPPFSFNFHLNFRESMQPGEIRAITFSGNLPNFKYITHWREVTSATLPLPLCVKAILVSSLKRSSRTSRPLGLLFKLNLMFQHAKKNYEVS